MNVEHADEESEAPVRRPRKPDRWAHRRGEPRVFAFLWTLYLLGATLFGFGSLGAIGAIDAGTYRAVARVILISVAVGVVVVWPMTRLSQLKPTRRGVRLAWADFVVIAAPLQAVVLPQVFLPFGWSKMIVLALSAILTAWVFAIAGLLAIALGQGSGEGLRRPPARGWLWMLVIVVVAFAMPSILLVSNSPGTDVGSDIRVRWLASPVTGVYELTRKRPLTSIAPQVYARDWIVIGSPVAIGSILWLVAFGRRSRKEARAAPRSGV